MSNVPFPFFVPPFPFDLPCALCLVNYQVSVLSVTGADHESSILPHPVRRDARRDLVAGRNRARGGPERGGRACQRPATGALHGRLPERADRRQTPGVLRPPRRDANLRLPAGPRRDARTVHGGRVDGAARSRVEARHQRRDDRAAVPGLVARRSHQARRRSCSGRARSASATSSTFRTTIRHCARRASRRSNTT